LQLIFPTAQDNSHFENLQVTAKDDFFAEGGFENPTGHVVHHIATEPHPHHQTLSQINMDLEGKK